MSLAELPANFDIDLIRGNNTLHEFRILVDNVAMNLTGDTWILSIVWSRGALRKSTATGDMTLQPTLGIIQWQPVLAETRRIPSDGSARFELERRAAGGEQRTYLTGKMIGNGGLNND